MSEPKSATDYLPRDEKPYHYPGDDCELERKAKEQFKEAARMYVNRDHVKLPPAYLPREFDEFDWAVFTTYWAFMLIVGGLIGYMLARVL